VFFCQPPLAYVYIHYVCMDVGIYLRFYKFFGNREDSYLASLDA